MDVSLVAVIELNDEQWEYLLRIIPLTNYRLSPINRVVCEIHNAEWVLGRMGYYFRVRHGDYR